MNISVVLKFQVNLWLIYRGARHNSWAAHIQPLIQAWVMFSSRSLGLMLGLMLSWFLRRPLKQTRSDYFPAGSTLVNQHTVFKIQHWTWLLGNQSCSSEKQSVACLTPSLAQCQTCMEKAHFLCQRLSDRMTSLPYTDWHWQDIFHGFHFKSRDSMNPICSPKIF